MAANILIATPQTEFGELLRLNIEESGDHIISIVHTGQDVMETANKIKFDLAILDPGLTDKPFVPLAQNLLDENPGLRLVVIQAQNRSKDPALDELSPHAYLSRPFFPPDLIEMIEGLLSVSVAPPVAPPAAPQPESAPELVTKEPPAVEITEAVSPNANMTPEPPPTQAEEPGLSNTLEELEKELAMMEGDQDKPAGQAEIDMLLAQLRATQTEEEPEPPQSIIAPPTPPIEGSGIVFSSQTQIDPQFTAGGSLKSQDDIFGAQTETVPEDSVEKDQSLNGKEILFEMTEIESQTGISSANLHSPTYAGENLFIPDIELTKKHNEMAEKYAALASEYTRLANEHAQLAAKHADLAEERAKKDRENLKRLKALDPIIEKLKQQLTDSTAHAAIIIKTGEIVAFAGEITYEVAQEIIITIEQNWDNNNQSDLVRFVRMDALKSEYMLYATVIKEDFILGLIFDIAMPLSRMRSQTSQFSRALSNLPLGLLPTEMESRSEYELGEEIDPDSLPPIAPNPFLNQPDVLEDEWIPENIVSETQHNSNAHEILKDVLSQLETTPYDLTKGDELSFEDELISLYAQGPRETNISAPVLPDIDNDLLDLTIFDPADRDGKEIDNTPEEFEISENEENIPGVESDFIAENYGTFIDIPNDPTGENESEGIDGSQIFQSVLDQLISQTITPSSIADDETEVPVDWASVDVNTDDETSEVFQQDENQLSLTNSPMDNQTPENEAQNEESGSGGILDGQVTDEESLDFLLADLLKEEINGTKFDTEASLEETSAGLAEKNEMIPLQGQFDSLEDVSDEENTGEIIEEIVPGNSDDLTANEDFLDDSSESENQATPPTAVIGETPALQGVEEVIVADFHSEDNISGITPENENLEFVQDDITELEISTIHSSSSSPEIKTGELLSDLQITSEENVIPLPKPYEGELEISQGIEKSDAIPEISEMLSETPELQDDNSHLGFSEPDIESILARVRSKLNPQDTPALASDLIIDNQDIESIHEEIYTENQQAEDPGRDDNQAIIFEDVDQTSQKEPETPFDSSEIDRSPSVSPFLLPQETNPGSSFTDLVLDDIFSQLETPEDIAGTSEEEAIDRDYLFPWEHQDEESIDIPTQPIIISNTLHPAPDETKSEREIPTQPVRIGTSVSDSENTLDAVKANLVAVALQPHPDEQPGEINIQEPIKLSGKEGQIGETGNEHNEAMPDMLSNLFYTCVLVPRSEGMQIDEAINQLLSDMMPQICLVFGWVLEKVEISPHYMLWAVQVNPAVSPGNLIRVTRKWTSNSIFEKFPQLKTFNFRGDFWAPGYLVLSGDDVLEEKTLDDFIQQTHRRQNLLKFPNH